MKLDLLSSNLKPMLFYMLALMCSSFPVYSAVEGTPPSVKEILDSQAEADAPQKQEDSPNTPHDKFNRGTPQGTMKGLASAFDNYDFELATQYMDFRNLPAGITDDHQELARKLQIIANRTIWVDMERISNNPKGDLDDELPKYREYIATLDTPDGQLPILLQKIPRDKGVYVWKVSNKTVAQIPKLYKYYGHGKIGDWFSRQLPSFHFLNMHLWQWVMLLIIGTIAYFTAWGITAGLNLVFWRTDSPIHTRRRLFVARPGRFLLMVLIVRSLFDYIHPSLQARAIYDAGTLMIIAVAWITAGVIGLAFGRLGDRMQASGSNNASLLLRPATTAVKVTVFLFAVIIWLDNMGFEVTTLVAGLGVGSIAVALASKRSLENLIGAITLYTAQPVKVGDFCKFGATVGTIEEVGLRSTKIRTLTRSIVTIPNAIFVDMELENFSEIDQRPFHRRIHLRLDTTPDQLRYILIELQQMLYSHQGLDAESASARLMEIGEYAVDIEVRVNTIATERAEFLKIAEDIQLRMLDIVKKAGADLTTPYQSLLVETEPDSRSQRQTEAEKTVSRWRDTNELNLPEFPDEVREKLRDSLDYPPKGSAVFKESRKGA